MFLLGLLLPICYIPGLTGASIPTQWALLSIAFAISLWREPSTPPSSLHYLGLGFLAFAALGLLWAPNLWDGLYALWLVLLWALSFRLGSATASPANLYRGLAIGLSVSSVLAIFQWFGYSTIPTANGSNIAGLLFNRTVLGATTALVILGLISERLWLYIPMLLPGLILSGSRGGWLILMVGLLARMHILIALGLTLACALALSFVPDSSDALRLQIWGVTLRGLTLFGHGPGSFTSLYFPAGPALIHPEFVHNDYLQLWFEFGVGALVPIAILTVAIAWSRSPIPIAFACLAAFYFPLWTPLTAFIGCFVVGHALRGFSWDRLLVRRCRPDLVSWLDPAQFIARQARRHPLPPLSRTTQSEA